ncbi:MAG: hypothetical protein LBG88_03130 [Christensenellaceae bacterium]|jgi:hypothetical protein|nr:hypothetical protein [Christensenellaceae bacterium]
MTSIDPPKSWYVDWYKKDLAKAEQGDAKAMLSVARLVKKAIPKDHYHPTPKEKLKVAELETFWTTKSAQAGNPEAQYKLGSSLMKSDTKRGIEFWEMAAAQNHPYAQENLADLFEAGMFKSEGLQGITVPKDINRSIKWRTALADNTDPYDERYSSSKDSWHNGKRQQAFKSLMLAYLRGTDVPRDYDKAYEYYKREKEFDYYSFGKDAETKEEFIELMKPDIEWHDFKRKGFSDVCIGGPSYPEFESENDFVVCGVYIVKHTKTIVVFNEIVYVFTDADFKKFRAHIIKDYYEPNTENSGLPDNFIRIHCKKDRSASKQINNNEVYNRLLDELKNIVMKQLS